jgi:predicted lipid-binding transport protein (Tim44 family)
MTQRGRPFSRAMLAIGLVAALAAAPVDARRGGSFGSRGSRTYAAPQSTRLSPGYTPGVARSMTPRSGYQSPAYAPAPSYGPAGYGARRPGLFGGFGGGLLTGVLAGGLIGSLFGHHGWGGGYGGGGGGGFLAGLIQLAILGGIVWLVIGFFRRRRDDAPPPQSFRDAPAYAAAPYPAGPGYAPAPAQAGEDITLSDDDQAAFERLLIELQDAFGQEDYARLRAITTPEIMSYLAEELSDNATHGRRNDVTGTRLLDGEVSEAWREGDSDYATIVMRYEGIDVMRDRATRALLSGDASRPTETTELWTFVRPAGAWSGWKVSAIQEG